MSILVTYDVSTETAAGRRRLRKIAEACLAFGQRVQKSVFECLLSEMQLEALRYRLLQSI
ncbi:MAG: CRISPR-associated endonuclease Cas2, partial [Ktedonobacterales bacterium]|nr:CRISPR-associated endonuclease Cas2 [Ktedonobacterales bacterium]